MTLWTFFQSPLMYGGTLPDIDNFTLSLFTNLDILEMYSKIKERRQIHREKDWVIWMAKTEKDSYFAFFNISEDNCLLPERLWIQLLNEDKVFDLWQQKCIQLNNHIIEKHGVLAIRIISD